MATIALRDHSAQKHIYFATTSDIKYRQYKCIFDAYDIDLRRGTSISSALVEPQADHALDPSGQLMVSHPLRQAARFVSRSGQTPYMIEDTMLFIEAFSKNMDEFVGLPGADTKNWWHNLGAKGVLDLLSRASTRKAMFTCQLGVYLGDSSYEFARASLYGEISEEPRSSQEAVEAVPQANPYFFHQIFVPDAATRTLAEMSGGDFSTFDYRRECAERLVQILVHTDALEGDPQLRLAVGFED